MYLTGLARAPAAERPARGCRRGARQFIGRVRRNKFMNPCLELFVVGSYIYTRNPSAVQSAGTARLKYSNLLFGMTREIFFVLHLHGLIKTLFLQKCVKYSNLMLGLLGWAGPSNLSSPATGTYTG